MREKIANENNFAAGRTEKLALRASENDRPDKLRLRCATLTHVKVMLMLRVGPIWLMRA